MLSFLFVVVVSAAAAAAAFVGLQDCSVSMGVLVCCNALFIHINSLQTKKVTIAHTKMYVTKEIRI